MLRKWPALQVESESFLHLDALRFLASMGIVAYHWRAQLVLAPPWTGVSAGIEGFTYFVDLFFVISGFIITHVYSPRMARFGDYLSFLAKRIARLGPLHWATLIFFAGIGALGAFASLKLAHAQNYDPACFLPNVAFLQAFGLCDHRSFNFPSWSISAEMGCYALFPLYLVFYRINVWLPAVVAAALIGIYAWMGHIGPERDHWYDLSYYWGVARALPAFGFGVTLYGLRGMLGRVPFAGWILGALLCAFVAGSELRAPNWLELALAYLIVVAGVASDAAGRTGPLVRTLAPWGSLTYSTYMLHVPVTVLFSVVFMKLLHLPPLLMNIAVFASVPLLLFISYLSYVFFETPARRLLTPRRAPAAVSASVETG